MELQIHARTLHFKQPATTSRGSYTERKVWYVVMKDAGTARYGIGECAPLEDLSCDAFPSAQYEALLHEVASDFRRYGVQSLERWPHCPSVCFGFSAAYQHFTYGKLRYHNTPFSCGKVGMPINGLVWMGTIEQMQQRIEEKLSQGFHCIKLKVGAQDFHREVALLAAIRERYSSHELELRLDANGAFAPDEAMDKLELLAQYGIHSIEQPIRAGQIAQMAKLCRQSPIPIALDEELIGHHTLAEKMKLLEAINPPYVVLKPTLVGSVEVARSLYTWIRSCRKKVWFTSALESNVGLNAIAQLATALHVDMPQGLGTGQLFTDNCPSPLYMQGSALWYNSQSADPNYLEWLS